MYIYNIIYFLIIYTIEKTKTVLVFFVKIKEEVAREIRVLSEVMAMFTKGSLIIYGNNGVCTVDDITTLRDTGERLYYVLKLGNGGVAYVPVDSPVYMRRIMTPEKAYELLDKIPLIDTEKFRNISIREAQKAYHDAFNSHSTEQLIALIKHIFAVSIRKRSANKKLSTTEERYFEQSLKIVESELRVAIGITEDEFLHKISDAVGEVV